MAAAEEATEHAWRDPERVRSFFELREQRREVSADYVQSGAFELTTRDDNDHTFHGIVFNVELTGSVPVEWLDVCGVSVRGALGEVKVLSAAGGFEPNLTLDDRPEMRRYFSPLKPPNEWKLRFAGDVPAAPRGPRELPFAQPARLAPRDAGDADGAARHRLGVYVHAESSDGVVYNNQRHRGVTLEDAHVRILSGVAHTGGAPFARVGYWGDVAWRPRREFVGAVKYEVRLLLWTPDAHGRFGAGFRRLVKTFLLCRASHVLRDAGACGLGHLPLEALYYCLAFARHDWAPDDDAPAADDAASDGDEAWEVRRDAYGSRVLVPRSQCTNDDTDDDDDDDMDDDMDDDDDDDDYYDDDDQDFVDDDDDDDDDDELPAPPEEDHVAEHAWAETVAAALEDLDEPDDGSEEEAAAAVPPPPPDA